MKDHFDNEELQQLLNDFEQWDDQDELNEIKSEIISNQTSINFNVTEKKYIKWDRVPFCPPELKLKDLEERNYPPEMPSITDYFYEYLNDDIFEKIVYYTNLYAIQNSQIRYKPTNCNEIKNFIGIHLF